MVSPWQANGLGTYTVPGLAQLLMQRNQETQNAFGQIGQFAGAVGSGITGAVQASNNPGVFGDGTSSDQAAVQGGLMNFASAYGGNAQPQSNFASMVGSGQNGAPAAGGGMTFAQFAAQGKLADATRNLIKQTTPTLPDQDPAPMGYTDDEWQHLGTRDKVAAFAAVKQSNDLQQQQQGIALGAARMADLEAQAQQRQAQADEANGLGQVFANLPPKGSNGDGTYSQNDFVQAAKNAQLAPKVQGAIMSRFIQPQAKATFFKPDDMGQPVPGMPGLIRIPTGPNTSEIRDSNGAQVTPLTDDDGNTIGYGVSDGKGGMKTMAAPKSGVKFKAVPSITDPSGFATSVEADTPEQLQQGMALLKQAQPGSAATTPGASAPAAAPVGPTATNPKTGQKMIFTNGKWQPLTP